MDEQQQPGGLLNFFQSPGGQGLLSAIAGYAAGARRGTPVNNIGRGLLSGVAGYQGAQQEQIKQQKEQRELAQQQKWQTLMGNPQASIAELMAAGAPVDVLRLKHDMTRPAKAFARVTERGQDGRPRDVIVDEYGNRMGEGFASYEKPERPQRPQILNTSQGIFSIGDDNVPTPLAAPGGEGVLMPYNATAASNAAGGVGGVAPKPMTESQSKDSLFGSRAKESNAIIAKLSANGVNKPYLGIGSNGGGLVGGLVNMAQPPEFKQLDQAKSDFINAVLRKESGAVISPSEFENAERQYFPRVGDDPATIAQKAKNRELAIQGILASVPEAHRMGAQQPGQHAGADDSILQEAQDAIRQGAPAAQVIQELRKQGIDPSALMRGSVGNAIGSVFQ